MTMENTLGVNFNFGRAHWSAENFLKFQEILANQAGVNWEIFQTHKRDGTCPPPPYKEPLMWLVYATDGAQIPWRQCEKIVPKLLNLADSWGEEDDDSGQVYLLVQGMREAVRRHRPIEFW